MDKEKSKFNENYNDFNNNYYNQNDGKIHLRRINELPNKADQINSMYFNNDSNFNENMNNIVRTSLKSRGVVLPHDKKPIISNIDSNGLDRTENNVTDNYERKKMLLNNIQHQICLTNNSKLLDLQRKKMEEEKYLKEMQQFYPFGRGGAGAPIRDKLGNVVTSRRALISDPKYQHFSINVDDDFANTSANKQYGLINFINKNSQIQNVNSDRAQSSKELHSRGIIKNPFTYDYIDIPNRSKNYNENIRENNYYPNNNNQSSLQNNFSLESSNEPKLMIDNGREIIESAYPQAGYGYQQPERNNFNHNNGAIYHPATGNNPQFINYYNPPNYDNYCSNNYDNNQIPNSNMDPKNNQSLNISYRNHEIDGDKKKQKTIEYGNELRKQMEEVKRKKENEKEMKKIEELEEEMRVKKEVEFMKMQDELEKEKKKNDLEKLNFENKSLLNQSVAIKNKKIVKLDNHNKIEENYNNNQFKHIDESNYGNEFQNNYIPQNNFATQNIHTPYNNFNPENSLNSQRHQQDFEMKENLNNEIKKLRNNLIEQQNILLKQVNDLKEETQNANLQRYEVLKEFSVLKEELSKQRVDEEMRRKYVYDVLVDNNNNVNCNYGTMKLPDLNNDDFKVELPKIKNHLSNIKKFQYDDSVKHPNNIVDVPKLNYNKDQPIKTSSKFIDMENHKVIDNLNVYESKSENKNHTNSKGYHLDEDFGVLRSYYKDKNDKDYLNKYFNKHITDHEQISTIDDTATNPNIFNKKGKENFYFKDDKFSNNILDEDELSIHQIYNKNIERLKFLNNLEDKI